jgi:hypothetical protein
MLAQKRYSDSEKPEYNNINMNINILLYMLSRLLANGDTVKKLEHDDINMNIIIDNIDLRYMLLGLLANSDTVKKLALRKVFLRTHADARTTVILALNDMNVIITIRMIHYLLPGKPCCALILTLVIR